MANNKVAGFLFLFSPVLGLLEAFKNLRSRHSRNVLFVFCLCFGICFSVDTNRYEGSMDGVSMRADFEESKNLTTGQYLSYLHDYFEFDSGAQDIYIVTVSYIVGRFTDNFHYFFLVLAFVFAFFQLKCLRYFVQEDNYATSTICIILTCLFLWNNIYNINGARFWTAAWIGLFSAFKIFYENKPLYLLLAMCTILVHSFFVVFPFVLLLAYFTKQFNKLWFLLFCVSWFFSVIAEDFHITPFKNIELPFLVEQKIEYYLDRKYIESLSQGTGFFWVRQLFRTLSRHFIEFLILLIALNKKRLSNKRASSVVGIMIVLATVANFGMVVPTFGNRYFAVNYALVAYSFLVCFGDKKYRILVYALPFVWLANLYYLSSDIIKVLDLGFLLSPVFSFIRFTFV